MTENKGKWWTVSL